MTRLAERVALLLDVDTGIDDSLALLYACASPNAAIVAVTCVAGNVDARQVAENTRAVLELAGRDDVEVALGRETPLVRPLVTTPETHGPRGIGYAELPPARRPLSDRHAADLIIEEARRRPGEITLVTLGPATNLAVALLREPELPLLLRRWVLMGGSYRSPGNTAPTTEWNASVDPDALKVAIAGFGDPDLVARRRAAGLAGLPLALGLDVTERAKLLPAHLALLVSRAGGSTATHPLLRYLDDALRFYMEFHSRYDGFYGAFIHDPLAVAAALDPSLVRRRWPTGGRPGAGRPPCRSGWKRGSTSSSSASSSTSGTSPPGSAPAERRRSAGSAGGVTGGGGILRQAPCGRVAHRTGRR
jgi:purine nucleosidase